MDAAENPKTQDPFAGTVTDELDRLEILSTKIGQLKADDALNLLYALDRVYARIQELGRETPSRRLAETQLQTIVARIRSEAGRFMRDLGGATALQQAREKQPPAEDHQWWFLDAWLAQRRRASLRRMLMVCGGAILLLILMSVVYQQFLAPDPQVAARYTFEQNAQDRLVSGDYAEALHEVEQGLQVAPQDPSLLTLQGVLLEKLGKADQAGPSFARAEAGLPSRADFLVTRAQVYLMANQVDQGLADAQAAVQLNPQFAQAYLVLGQGYEMMGNYAEAIQNYDQAFETADKTGQTELAAITRMRKAMIVQRMNLQPSSPTPEPSLTPAK